MDNKKIGGFLQALRKAKGKTQQDIADYFFVSAKTVSKWECGSAIPEIGMLISLAEYYDVTIDEILKGEKATAGKEITEDTEKRNKKEREKYFVNRRKDRINMFVLISLFITLVGYFLLIAVGYTTFYATLSGMLSLLFSVIGIMTCIMGLHIKKYQYEDLISEEKCNKLKLFQFKREYLFYCVTLTIMVSSVILMLFSGSINFILEFSYLMKYSALMLLWEIPLYIIVYLLILKYKFNIGKQLNCRKYLKIIGNLLIKYGYKIIKCISIIGVAVLMIFYQVAKADYGDGYKIIFIFDVFNYKNATYWAICFL